jgi:hypothetical protein
LVPTTRRVEEQHGLLRLDTGEDAVAAREMPVEPRFAHLARRRLEQHCILDRIDRESAQRLPFVTPGVEVPVLAVVDHALRRDVTGAATDGVSHLQGCQRA